MRGTRPRRAARTRPPRRAASTSTERSGIVIEDEYLAGWDPTPGIVSVWADADGHATLWRRLPDTGALVRDDVQFRPWLVLDRLDDLHHLDDRLAEEGTARAPVTYRELRGPGALRYVVRARTLATLTSAVVH